MKYPMLHIYLDDENTLCFSKVEQPGGEARLIIDVPWDEIEKIGLAQLNEKVGGTVVGLLKVWNTELFSSINGAAGEK